jgi:tRNA threonylcarbamoyladenosine biosynthesis protein TsaE
MSQSLQINLVAREDTERLGFDLASVVAGRGLVLLQGPLGAGKTTFAKGVARAFGIEEVVTSPTFTMLNEYTSGRLPLYHLDLYRLRDEERTASEANAGMLQAELEEISLSDGLILVEWPDALMDYFSMQDFVCVELNYSESLLGNDGSLDSVDESGRSARVSAHGDGSAQVVELLANVYFS